MFIYLHHIMKRTFLMYTMQFPPVPSSYINSGVGTWNTSVNYNRAIFDINGGGFFSGDSKTTVTKDTRFILFILLLMEYYGEQKINKN